MTKLRLDAALVARGITTSRSLAHQLIVSNSVEVCDAGVWKQAAKPSLKVSPEQGLRLSDERLLQYVSRAGLKLEKALPLIPIDIANTVAIDIGQSTGGFSDCLLKHGVRKVVGIDVGHDQLAEPLRNDTRVICIEGVNARDIPSAIRETYAPQGFDLGVMDVSFISQTLIIPGLSSLIKTGGVFVSLVKPQFEVGRENINKGGIVRNSALYLQVEQTIGAAFDTAGFTVAEYVESPITGADGNREFLVVAVRR